MPKTNPDSNHMLKKSCFLEVAFCPKRSGDIRNYRETVLKTCFIMTFPLKGARKSQKILEKKSSFLALFFGQKKPKIDPDSNLNPKILLFSEASLG